MSARPKPPAGVSVAGRGLWRAIVGDLPASMELDARELAVLTAAARQADTVAELEAAVDRDGVIVSGAAGQPRLNGAVTELRQGRLALARLLGELELPGEDQPVAVSAASRRARKAADARWAEHRARKAARGG